MKIEIGKQEAGAVLACLIQTSKSPKCPVSEMKYLNPPAKNLDEVDNVKTV